MAETTLLLIGLATSAAGSAVGAVSAIQSGRQQAKIEKENAIIAQQRALAEAEQHRQDTLRKIGSTRASYGDSGVQTTGTPMEVLNDDLLTAGRENKLILWGGDAQARGHRMQASAYRSKGIGEGIAGFGKAGGTLMTGLYSYNKIK